MKWFQVLMLCASTLLVFGKNEESLAVEQLPPIIIAPDDNGHINPVLVESVDENKPGQPDGHEDRSPSVIGQPDGHEQRNNPIGQPDGHEQRNNPIGQPDGHENRELLGRQDGHDFKAPMFGQPDGHELESHVAGQTDGSGSKSKNQDSSSYESLEDHDEKRADVDYPLYIDGEYDDDELSKPYDYDEDANKPLIRCTRPLCEIDCPMGFQYENSCPICKCLEDPCSKIKCDAGTKCRINICSPVNCTELSAECRDDTSQCATPMCANVCENGYYYNEYGCMTCDCAGSVYSEINEKNIECPQIDCVEQECTSGFMTDDNGCMTCQCKDDSKENFPCAMPMCADFCENGYHYDERGCMTCDCAKTEQDLNKPSDIKIDEKPVCAEPMCSNRCDQGYARDKNGCLTCDCAVGRQKCGRQVCEKDEKCLNHFVNESETSTCVPTPLCHALKESGDRLLNSSPKCDEKGKFLPVQCNEVQSECWCVDDRGVVIDGTRTSVYIDEHKPHCEKNITVGGTVHVRLVTIAASHPAYKYPYTVTDLLTSDIPISFSYCTLVDKDYISVVKVNKMIGGDEAAGGQDKPLTAVGSTFYAEVNMRNDGVVDLSAALDRLRRRIESGRCMVAIENGAVLEPAPESLMIEYKFSHTPARLPLVTNLDNGMYSSEGSLIEYYYNHKYTLIFVSLLAIFVTICILLIVIMIVRRRCRMGRMDFQHQRLHSQISTTSEKSLLDSRDDNVLLIGSGSVETNRMVNA